MQDRKIDRSLHAKTERPVRDKLPDGLQDGGLKNPPFPEKSVEG
jgi:hypothetical protein